MSKKAKQHITVTVTMGDGTIGRTYECDGIREAKQTFRRCLQTASRFGGAHVSAQDAQGNNVNSQLY